MQLFRHWSRLRKLSYLWSFLLFAHISSGIVLIVVSTIFRSQWARQANAKFALRSFVLKMLYLDYGLVLGILILLVSALGVFGFVQSLPKSRGTKTLGLVVFNWTLIVIILLSLIGATLIWFDTLQERARYFLLWSEQSTEMQAYFQDRLQCCGYWNATPDGGFRAAKGFCSDQVKALMSAPCVTPITTFADYLLNNIFTTIYGFTTIQVSLLLISICLIKVRRELERFRKLDEKQGGRGGFV